MRNILFAVIASIGLLNCDYDDSTLKTFASKKTPIPTKFTDYVVIADPYRSIYPNNTTDDNWARSIWDMQTYQGRIYIGSGDLDNNRGPIQIMSFDNLGNFQNEILVDEETVRLFRVYDNKLFIPGNDARESWEFGNFYYKENGIWTKKRTIPNGLHVMDIASFGGNLYVEAYTESGSYLMKSSDGGNTWNNLGIKGKSGHMAPLDSLMYVLANDFNTVDLAGNINYKYPKIHIKFYPEKTVRFANGALYGNDWFSSKNYRDLYYLGDLTSGSKKIKLNGRVKDVAVNNGVAYVLTYNSSTSGFTGRIFASSDAANWTKIAKFSVKAVPTSLEILNGEFYVGLGASALTFAPESDSGLIIKLK